MYVYRYIEFDHNQSTKLVRTVTVKEERKEEKSYITIEKYGRCQLWF